MRFISIILIIIMTGCSALASNTQQFSVTTSPETARIMINGQFSGRGAVLYKSSVIVPYLFK